MLTCGQRVVEMSGTAAHLGKITMKKRVFFLGVDRPLREFDRLRLITRIVGNERVKVKGVRVSGADLKDLAA